MSEVARAFHITGFSYGLPLVPTEAVVDQLKLSRVWDFDAATEQLALAVRVFPYPCGTFAAWVYIVVLSPK